MLILSIDPGPTESAWVLFDDVSKKPIRFAKEENSRILRHIGMPAGHPPTRAFSAGDGFERRGGHLAIELIASYGMPVGAEVFETCVWIGRFVERWGGTDWTPIKRHEVKMHLCHNSRAKDGNIRAALVDRYGGKDAAIGKKASPGPLYGVSGDVWAALSVAITYAETRATP